MRTRPNLLYNLLNKDYHESFDVYVPRTSDFYDRVAPVLPAGWRIQRRGIWFQCGVPSRVMPQQGWKIHVSATPANVHEVLDRVVPVIFRRSDSDFKFALDISVLFLLNSKNWSRGGSGKFITIYPPGNREFLELIEELHIATTGLVGPYILSDHRYKDSATVFYRYGGMRLYEVLNVNGEKTPMLVAPDGTEVPDQRLAYPITPSWVTTLLPMAESQASTADAYTLKGGRYKVEYVLAFSNAGGVYRARDLQTGDSVVIKEARPYVNATTDGCDAVELLKKEYRLLSLIAETGIAPRPIDLFQEWEHWLLVEEFIEGTPMGTHSTMHNVLLRTRPNASHYKEWFDTFMALCQSLVDIVATLHRHGIVFADLSPNNLIVLSGQTKLKVIDFEGAYQIGIDRPTNCYTPGFISQNRLSGDAAAFDDDYYAMGSVLFAYLFPLNSLFHLNSNAKYKVMNAIRRDIHLPKSVADMILDLIQEDKSQRPTSPQIRTVLQKAVACTETEDDEEEPINYSAVLDGIASQLHDIASYHRQDRLFPADPKLFVTNPLSLAFGATGVAYAMHKITGEFPGLMTDWILEREVTAEKYPPGLYIGLSGIAWALLEVGLRREAEKIFELTFGHRLLFDSPDLFYGIAGWGMTSLRFFLENQDERYLHKAKKAGQVLLKTAQTNERGYYWPRSNESPLGIAHGSSGIALFLLYLYLTTQCDEFLQAGLQALELDLSYGIETKDGGLSWAGAVESQSPLYPYWRYGSAGIGTVALRFYKLLGDTRYKAILDKIFIDTDRKYAVFPGRLLGLSGLGDFLMDMYEFTGDHKYLESTRKMARGIMHFRVDRRGVAFPGNFLSRLCCDYGTGSAGIALFLNRLANREPSDFMLDSLFATQVRWPSLQETQRQFRIPFSSPKADAAFSAASGR